jgi:citrate lyase subunit beta/citryl-CoA lyase
MSAAPRSYLFVPGNRPERFVKAAKAGADAMIIDLEDAVAPAEKTAAREAAAVWLAAGNKALVRVNGADTDWFLEDLELASLPGVTGLVLPKAERKEPLASAAGRLSGGGVLLPIIESAAGFACVEQLAAAPRVHRLMFGSIDFQVDLGIEGDGEELLYFRSCLVLASRLANLERPVDGVSVAIGDDAALQQDASRSRRLGFGGKLCIHPRQVAIVNQCFHPGAEDVAWAQRVTMAAQAAGGAAVAVDGRMVDRPVLLQAQRVLALVAAFGKRPPD